MTTLAQLPLQSVPLAEPQSSLAEVLSLLETDPLGLVVLVGDEMYMGVFNQQAIDSSLLPPGTDPALVQVGPYVHPIRPLRPSMSVAEALAQLNRKGVDALPLVDGQIYKGVITRAALEQA